MATYEIPDELKERARNSPSFSAPDPALVAESKAAEGDRELPERLGDALQCAFTRAVGWKSDAERSGLDLETSPTVWGELGAGGTVLRGTVKTVIYDDVPIWRTYATDEDPKRGARVRKALDDELTDPDGWSLGSLTRRLRRSANASRNEALAIAREESAFVIKTTRRSLDDKYDVDVPSTGELSADSSDD